MKIVIAPDSYKESLTSMEVATAIEKGFRQILPNISYFKVPMADGGEGTVQSLVDATNGSILEVVVMGPLGDNVIGFLGLTGDKKTVIIEIAAAAGLHLVPESKRDPRLTTSYGVGELIKAALDLRVDKIIIGLGGSATNDGGSGMLQALGGKLKDALGQDIPLGGGGLQLLDSIDLSGLDKRLSSIQIDVACDVDSPLCGKEGASYMFGPQKGATANIVELLDANLSHYGALIERQLGKKIITLPGAGAAGGIGAALFGVLNGRLRSGVEIVMDAVGLEQQIQNADLVITGEGRIDSQSIHGKTPIGVAKLAKKYSLPVIGIAGSVAHDSDIVYEHGIDALFSVVNGACSLEEALQNAALNVQVTAKNVAKTLSLLTKI